MKAMIEPINLGDANNVHMGCVLPTVALEDRYVVEGARSAEGFVSGIVHVNLALGKGVIKGAEGKAIGYDKAAKIQTKLVFDRVAAEAVLKIVAQQLTTRFDLEGEIEDEYDVNELLAPKRKGGGGKTKVVVKSLAEMIAEKQAAGETPEAIQAWMMAEMQKAMAK
jgi:hypothetical protein